MCFTWVVDSHGETILCGVSPLEQLSGLDTARDVIDREHGEAGFRILDLECVGQQGVGCVLLIRIADLQLAQRAT